VSSSQKRAVQNHRARLSERGLARYEVLGLDSDRDLIRDLARSLAEKGPAEPELRATLMNALKGEASPPGGILAALRRSPLVGASLNLKRSRTGGRKAAI
jgi:plasmid stability protein